MNTINLRSSTLWCRCAATAGTAAMTAVLIVTLSVATASARPFRQPLETLINVRPNVMLLIDTGAHMGAILPGDGYDPDATYPVHKFGADSSLDGWLVAIDKLDAPGCHSGFTQADRDGQVLCLKLPAHHLYTRHYLDYLYSRFPNGSDLGAIQQNGTTVIPAITVLNAAISAARQLISSNPDVDFCLITTSGDDPSGTPDLPCGTDRTRLLEAIDALQADPMNTRPLSIAYRRIVRYFSDEQTSPVAWRCQSNAIVGFTDLGGPAGGDSATRQLTVAATNAYAQDLLGEELLDLSDNSYGRPHRPHQPATGDFPLQNLRSYLMTPSTSSSRFREVAKAGGGSAFSFDERTRLNGTMAHDLSRHRNTTAHGNQLVGEADAENGVLFYDAGFQIPGWSGSLQARELSVAEARPGGAETELVWDAEALLPSADRRNIFTGVEQAGPVAPSAVRLLPLEVDNLPHVSDPDLIDWIRGDRHQEQRYGGTYPNRDRILGSIVHGNPVLVGAVPNAGYNDQDYRAFTAMTASTGRPGMLYVVANDGMLHGFKTGREGGGEVFAYLPRMLHPRLQDLTTRAGRKRLFLDGQITVQDARIESSETDHALGIHAVGAHWRTVLVATAGRGQRGLFALDVTHPEDYQAQGGYDPQSLLWEINPQRHGNSFAALGYLINPVSIVRVAVEDGGQQWLVVTGNGIADNPGTEQQLRSTQSLIYTIDIATGEPRQSITLSRDGGGITSVTPVDIDGDSYTDRLYGADLSGIIWRLDWNPSTAQFDPWVNGSGEPEPLITLTGPRGQGGHRQPVTGGMEVAALPGRGHDSQQPDGVMLYFGTGALLNRSDITETPGTQSLYGVWDNDVAPARREQLVELSLDESLAATTVVRTISGPTSLTDRPATPRGWVIDLPVSGERMTGTPALLFDRVQFTTFASPPANSDPCTGSSRQFIVEVNAVTGGTDDQPVLDLNQDLVIDATDRTEQGEVPAGVELENDAALPLIIEMPGPQGPVLTRATLDPDGVPGLLATPITTRRIAWRRRANEQNQ